MVYSWQQSLNLQTRSIILFQEIKKLPNIIMNKTLPSADQKENRGWSFTVSGFLIQSLRINPYKHKKKYLVLLLPSSTQLPCSIFQCFHLLYFSVWQKLFCMPDKLVKKQSNTLSQTKLLCHNNTNQQKVCCWLIFELIL